MRRDVRKGAATRTSVSGFNLAKSGPFLGLPCAVTAESRPRFPTRCAAARVRRMACRDHPLCRVSSLPMGHPDQGPIRGRFLCSWTVSHVSPTAAKLNVGGIGAGVGAGRAGLHCAAKPLCAPLRWLTGHAIPCGSLCIARSRGAGPLNMSLRWKQPGNSATGVRPHGQEN